MFDRRPVVVGAGELVDWSREEESHDCWTGEGFAAAATFDWLGAAAAGDCVGAGGEAEA
jgi:hypothetical protein